MQLFSILSFFILLYIYSYILSICYSFTLLYYYNCITSFFFFVYRRKVKMIYSLCCCYCYIQYSIFYILFSLFLIAVFGSDIFSIYPILLFFSFVYCRANCDIFIYSYICYSYLYTIIVILSFSFFFFCRDGFRIYLDVLILCIAYTIQHILFFFSFLLPRKMLIYTVDIIVDIIVDTIVLCFIPISMLKFLLFLM